MKKLKLTQAAFGKLVGASTMTVVMWEKKAGRLKVIAKLRPGLIAARTMTAKEAGEKLADMPRTTKGKKRKK